MGKVKDWWGGILYRLTTVLGIERRNGFVQSDCSGMKESGL